MSPKESLQEPELLAGPVPGLRPWLVRSALALLSAAVIGLELTLMREFSLRFGQHVAAMIIGVALLGFGTSGALLTLGRAWFVDGGRRTKWLPRFALLFGAGAPIALQLSRLSPVNPHFLAWDLGGESLRILAIQSCMLVPFTLAAAVIGLSLTDEPKRVAGHYAANLTGSGVGAALFVLLLSVFGIRGLVATISVCGIAAGFCLGAGASVRLGWTAVVCIGAAAVSLVTMPHGPPPSPHKALSVLTEMPGTTTLAQARGPMGRVDAVAGPHVHVAPGLSLQYTDPLPPHVLLMHDGDQGGAVYRCVRREQWGFLDYTTAAAPYHLVPAPSVCVLGAGGGADIGLARYHGARRIVAVEANPSVVQLMTGPLAARSGDIYQAQGVVLRNADARGYLTTTGETFDIIQLPPIDSFGAAGSGMGASQESHLYTVEAVELMLTRLSPGGILCLTRWLRTPPRDGLRLVNVVAEAQRRLQLEPRKHLVALRNWVTLTVLASAAPFDAERLSRLKTFCERRGFDRCHEPGLAVEETNRFHVLTGPLYFEGIRELLGDDRECFVDDYLFDLSASTDDKPYFHHFFRWRALPAMRRELGGQSPAFVELSTAMLATCLAQSLLMAGVLFLVPLAVRRVVTRRRRPSSQSHAERATTRFACVYFALIGAGYMLLEMGFLHRFTRYLAHPVYAAATVIAAFLLFSGAGSFLSGRRGAETLVRTAATAGMVVAVVGAAYAFGLDRWLALTQGGSLPARAMVAALTVAPLAGAMGYLFPSGLRILQSHRGGYVPLAWGINGFASVAATIATPLIAMEIGFQRLTLIAAGLYAAAAITCLLVKGMGTDRGENQSD